jgi:hypothetical protein|tara:strand:+ start:1146 stop:1361 length:216 start_codon:yes stop_codon:yes gene_type:complete
MKISKKLLRRLAKDEMIELWDKKQDEWIQIPLDPKDPDVIKMKDIMYAEFEIRCVIEGMRLGIMKEKDELD